MIVHLMIVHRLFFFLLPHGLFACCHVSPPDISQKWPRVVFCFAPPIFRSQATCEASCSIRLLIVDVNFILIVPQVSRITFRLQNFSKALNHPKTYRAHLMTFKNMQSHVSLLSQATWLSLTPHLLNKIIWRNPKHYIMSYNIE